MAAVVSDYDVLLDYAVDLRRTVNAVTDLPLDKWSVIALQEDWVGRWGQSAMFPSELAFFLAVCEQPGDQADVRVRPL